MGASLRVSLRSSSWPLTWQGVAVVVAELALVEALVVRVAFGLELRVVRGRDSSDRRVAVELGLATAWLDLPST